MDRPDISRLQKNRSIYFKIGMIAALGFVLLAFNWTTTLYEPIDNADYPPEDMEEIQVERTVQLEKRQLPPPLVEPTDEWVAEAKELTNDPEPPAVEPLIDQPITDLKKPRTLPVPAPPKKPAPMPLPKETGKTPPDEIFQAVEEMPRFPGCEDEDLPKEEKQACAERKMLKYIYQKVKYPELAKEANIEGTALISFVIEKDGSIDQIKILKDPGGGCGREAQRVVKTMPDWIPGKQRGRTVRVRYNLPIRYRLD